MKPKKLSRDAKMSRRFYCALSTIHRSHLRKNRNVLLEYCFAVPVVVLMPHRNERVRTRNDYYLRIHLRNWRRS